MDSHPLVSRYLQTDDPKAKAQLLVLIKVQGLTVTTPPPADLHSQYHPAWEALPEERRQEIMNEWERIKPMPRWKGATKCISSKQS